MVVALLRPLALLVHTYMLNVKKQAMMSSRFADLLIAACVSCNLYNRGEGRKKGEKGDRVGQRHNDDELMKGRPVGEQQQQQQQQQASAPGAGQTSCRGDGGVGHTLARSIAAEMADNPSEQLLKEDQHSSEGTGTAKSSTNESGEGTTNESGEGTGNNRPDCARPMEGFDAAGAAADAVGAGESATNTSSSVDDTAGPCSKIEQATDQQQQPTTSSGNGNLKRPRPSTANKPKSRQSKLRVSLLHSDKYTDILHDTMKHIHQDRERLLSSLLLCCGFLRKTPAFFTVVEPKRATRGHLGRFHCPAYLDLLEYVLPAQEGGGGVDDPAISSPTRSYAPRPKDFHAVLDSYGLTEDCHLPEDPEGRALLWRYCQYVAGASLHAAHLLLTDRADVAINWGGGRHHAHTDRAGGFCFVNDAVLAIQHLIDDKRGSDGHGSPTDSGPILAEKKRVLYLDIDIHHADGVQSAFYDTDQVLTASFHRRAPGFFPPSGDPSEKGRSGTDGVGFALNLPLPKQITDDEFLAIFTLALDRLMMAYDPHCIVLCVGSDGIKGDPVVGTEGWNLTPEGLAECVRLTAKRCGGHSRTSSSGGAKPRKLLVLGAGGYHPPNAARTFLLSTAAACEGARPGMLWNELPKDVPQHEFFGRYGPEFHLISQGFGAGIMEGQETSKVANKYCAPSVIDPRNYDQRSKTFDDAKKSINMCSLFAQSKRESLASVLFNSKADDELKGAEDDWAVGPRKIKTSSGGGKRRKRNRQKAATGSAGGTDTSSCGGTSNSCSTTAASSATSEEENC